MTAAILAASCVWRIADFPKNKQFATRRIAPLARTLCFFETKETGIAPRPARNRKFTPPTTRSLPPCTASERTSPVAELFRFPWSRRNRGF